MQTRLKKKGSCINSLMDLPSALIRSRDLEQNTGDFEGHGFGCWLANDLKGPENMNTYDIYISCSWLKVFL